MGERGLPSTQSWGACLPPVSEDKGMCRNVLIEDNHPICGVLFHLAFFFFFIVPHEHLLMSVCA